MKDHFDPTQPIVVGLCGEAGAGKTTSAQIMSRPVDIPVIDEDDNTVQRYLAWEHLFFAMPIYEMHAIVTKTQGDDRANRVLYQLHDVLHSVMNSNISYDDLVELVYDVYHMPVNLEAVKDRTWLQQVGTELCRAHKEDCFIDWMSRRFRSLFLENKTLFPDALTTVIVVSDARMRNEIELIRDHPNGVLFKLLVSPEAQEQRLSQRDGVSLTKAQANHPTERQLSSIPDNWFDYIIDTDVMDVKHQGLYLKELVEKAIIDRTELIDA
jgi:dephospho-CoA kinase